MCYFFLCLIAQFYVDLFLIIKIIRETFLLKTMQYQIYRLITNSIAYKALILIVSYKALI